MGLRNMSCLAAQSVDKPYTSRIGLHNLSRSAALLFSPSGAGFNEPSTARARLFLKDEHYPLRQNKVY